MPGHKFYFKRVLQSTFLATYFFLSAVLKPFYFSCWLPANPEFNVFSLGIRVQLCCITFCVLFLIPDSFCLTSKENACVCVCVCVCNTAVYEKIDDV